VFREGAPHGRHIRWPLATIKFKLTRSNKRFASSGCLVGRPEVNLSVVSCCLIAKALIEPREELQISKLRANRNLHQPNRRRSGADCESFGWERLDEIARLRRLLLARPEIAPRLLPPEL
jgi:hypothetical protein